MTGTLKSVVDAEDVADIMELNQVPFGNNFYATTECGAGPYSPTKRHCWAGKCVVDSPAADCFTGDIVTQHGDTEKNVNRMQACAKSQNATWLEYFPFLTCMETAYSVAAATGCTKGTRIDPTKLQACYSGKDGDVAQVREAKQTIDHDGTPFTQINGKEFDRQSSLLQAICDAYTGTKPAGCSSSSVVMV